MKTRHPKPYPKYKPSGVEWLGDVPAHWEVRRLKRICRLAYGDSLSSEDRVDGSVPVYGSNGQVGFHSFPNTNGQCLIIGRKGSFGKVQYSSEPVFAIDTTFFVDSRYTDANIRWLYYLLGWLQLDEVSKDSAVPGLNREDAYQYIGFYPPLSEQTAIVRYLDHTDRRIRRYVSSRERLIELLEEYRQAVIHHAVTRGLDPDMRLKPSGVEWLGDVPAHWEMRRVKQVSRILRGKFTHRPRNDPSLYNGPYPFIQTGDVARAKKMITEYSQTLNKQGLAVSKMFPTGTLVMTIAANIGDVAILDFEACFPDSVVGFVPHQNVDRDYLYYLFRAMKAEFLRETPVNTQGNLNVERIGARHIALPSISEQTTIVAYLDKATADIDAAIDRARREIELLGEYRTRLIADVVTGKVDVREAVADLPQ